MIMNMFKVTSKDKFNYSQFMFYVTFLNAFFFSCMLHNNKIYFGGFEVIFRVILKNTKKHGISILHMGLGQGANPILWYYILISFLSMF